VKRCLFPDCSAPSDSLFYLIPDDGQLMAWPMSIPYLVEPVPLCDWHGCLIGEGKLSQPTRPTLDWLPDVIQLLRVDQRRTR
jgi:hypothetical protein